MRYGKACLPVWGGWFRSGAVKFLAIFDRFGCNGMKGRGMSEQENKIDESGYPAVLKTLRSPLSVFGLAMLICNGVFSMAAAFMNSLEAFIYSIHTFLAIVFSFVIIAIWSPRSLYHPSELAGMDKELPEIKHSRLVVTVVFMVSAFSYAGYQIYTSSK